MSFDPSKLPAVLADAEKVIPDLIQLATDLNALFGGASEAQIKAVFDEAGINPTRICNLISLYNMAIPFIEMFSKVVLPPMPYPSFCTNPTPTPTPTPAG